ncbi:MAG: TMEM165/GDT1 family protein [Candidatus Geothermincolia bacterium]
MWKAFGAAFGLTFIAELGDKTQIAVLTLSARYGWLPTFLGAAAAFTILNALAVTVGEVLAKVVPADVIRYVSAAIFIIFGLLSFRHVDEEEEDKPGNSRNPFLTALIYVALMELGDKTQLSLVALTSRFKQPVWVFLGGTIALILSAFIGAIIGKWLGHFIPIKWIRWISGVVFIVFGILMATGVF